MLSLFKKKFKKDGVLFFKVKARPNAALNLIKEVMADKTIKIDIAAPADKGKANRELIRFLAKEFGVKTGNIEIIKGEKEKIKIIKIS